jgi:hypothetical protein
VAIARFLLSRRWWCSAVARSTLSRPGKRRGRVRRPAADVGHSRPLKGRSGGPRRPIPAGVKDGGRRRQALRSPRVRGPWFGAGKASRKGWCRRTRGKRRSKRRRLPLPDDDRLARLRPLWMKGDFDELVAPASARPQERLERLKRAFALGDLAALERDPTADRGRWHCRGQGALGVCRPVETGAERRIARPSTSSCAPSSGASDLRGKTMATCDGLCHQAFYEAGGHP